MARVLLTVFGLILLIPGACALGFMGVGVTMLPGFVRSGGMDMGDIVLPFLLLWAVCFAISYGGIVLIRSANSSKR